MTDYQDNPEAVKFRDWFQSISVKPGVVVLTYEPDNVVPINYGFIDHTPDPSVPPSCGMRVFLQDYDGQTCNVDYFTAYPSLDNDATRLTLDQQKDFDPSKLDSENLPAEAWRIGWEAMLNPLAHMIGTMQADFMYVQAERLGFDIDAFMEEASKSVHPLVAPHLAVTFVRYLFLKDKISNMESDDARTRAVTYLLEIIGEMLSGTYDILRNRKGK